MDEELKQNLTAAETWIRGLFILLFVFLLVVARVVTGAVVVIQFLFTVFSGRTNENLRSFGASLAQFIFQTLLFLTYNSDTKPFPFSPWPNAADAGSDTSWFDTNVDTGAGEKKSADVEVVESVEIIESDEPDEHEPRA
jgi:hypothetical protein